MEKDIKFGFKDLLVWQKSMDYVDHVLNVTEDLAKTKRHFRLIEQLESCSSSVPQNIAEGKGRRSDKEYIQFLYISRSSLYESITLLNIFERRNWITKNMLMDLESKAYEIACMIKGLINSLYKS